tara:strand:- start:6692 stop:6886 length:195 start_codon:yes stop_codon:yes gene_type:complete
MTKEALKHWYEHKRDKKSLTAKIASKSRTEHHKAEIKAKEKRDTKQRIKEQKEHIQYLRDKGEI